MRALVTGPTELVVPHLLQRLLERGDAVRLLARGSELPSTVTEHVEFLDGDLFDEGAVARAVARVEVVYHLAQQWPSPGIGARDLFLANVEVVRRLLEASAGTVGRLVFCSSVLVYRPAPWPFLWPISEGAERLAHGSDGLRLYGQTKIDAEDLLLRAQRDGALESVVLRPSVTYGPGAPFVEELIDQIILDPGTVPSTGRRVGTMQWVHVRDFADALVLAGTHPAAANEVFNVAGNEPITVAALRRAIREDLAGAPPFMPRGPWFAGRRRAGGAGAHELKFDIGKARRALGYTPLVRFRDGLRELVEGWPETRPASRATARRRARPRRPARGDRVHPESVDGYYEIALAKDRLADYYDYSDFWNFGYWESGTSSQVEACETLVEKLLELIPSKEGTILDLACGKGATTRHLLNHYDLGNIIAATNSLGQLRVGRGNAPGSMFCAMDAVNLALRDESVQSIICVEAACHFDTRADFLREAFRVLRPGGVLVVADAVLSPEAPTQPTANYVASVVEYEQQYRRAGFAEVVMRDVTANCWEPFVDHVAEYARQELATGNMTMPQHRRFKRWLLSIPVERYIVGSASK